MIARRASNRDGYTLIELLVVVAIIVLLGALVAPTLSGQEGNTKVRAAADAVTGDIAMARSRAMDEGRNYRVSISQDGTKIRVSPDDPDAQTEGEQAKPFQFEKQMPDDVTLVPIITGSEMSTADAEGWVRLATFLQDGTCREDLVDFEIREAGVIPLVVQIRGLTGHVTVNAAAAKQQ